MFVPQATYLLNVAHLVCTCCHSTTISSTRVRPVVCATCDEHLVEKVQYMHHPKTIAVKCSDCKNLSH
jgi:predicted metal-binding protein